MIRSTFARRIFLALILASPWLPAIPAAAQLSVTLRASAPITDDFPQVTLYLAVTDSTGRHLPGLAQNNFSVFEDETMLLDLTVSEQNVGTRQVFVLNTTLDMKVRDAFGRSRFDRARQALLSWWQLPSASLLGVDDLRLITTEGVLISQSRSAANLAARLDNFTPAFEDTLTGYELLLQALDLIADPPAHPGMPTHLIFLTPLLRIPRDIPISNIITRARQTGTILHPILMGQPENLEQPEAEPLRQIADATGGQLLLFDPDLGLNEFAERILAQRTQYQLTYTSKAITSGSHRVQVRLTDVDLETFSEIRTFDINVLPPEVAFIQPPDLIVRQTEDPTLAIEDLPPNREDLQLLVTFPDEHPRPLSRSQLIVDGEIVNERLEAPFQEIEWDLTDYLQDETHSIQVVVEDILGLQGVSIELPVFVEVRTPPRGLATLRSAIGPVLAALAVLIAGILLAASLVNMSRGRTATVTTQKKEAPSRRSTLIRAGLRRQAAAEEAEAHLIPLGPHGEEGEPIPLTGVEFILGRDPSMTAVPFDDPSVSGMHARMIRLAGGGYLLRDQGSIAGTWVNYDEVPEDGKRLTHGDLIHIGRVTLRFQLSSTPKPLEIYIRPADQHQAKPESNQETES
ncbi:MAG: FHA domain-containing protein [Anaerolineales bacterium]|nr:FHA domain-containing protein [Anaerolineales bacterium]